MSCTFCYNVGTIEAWLPLPLALGASCAPSCCEPSPQFPEVAVMIAHAARTAGREHPSHSQISSSLRELLSARPLPLLSGTLPEMRVYFHVVTRLPSSD